MFMDYQQLVALIGRAECVTYTELNLRDHTQEYVIKGIFNEVSGFKNTYEKVEELYKEFITEYGDSMEKYSAKPYLEYLTDFLQNKDECLAWQIVNGVLYTITTTSYNGGC